jgi:hypothetical protein
MLALNDAASLQFLICSKLNDQQRERRSQATSIHLGRRMSPSVEPNIYKCMHQY